MLLRSTALLVLCIFLPSFGLGPGDRLWTSPITVLPLIVLDTAVLKLIVDIDPNTGCSVLRRCKEAYLRC